MDETLPESLAETTTIDDESTTLRPITKTMIPKQQPKATFAKLTPVKHMLKAEKKERGTPPPKDFGKKSDKDA